MVMKTRNVCSKQFLDVLRIVVGNSRSTLCFSETGAISICPDSEKNVGTPETSPHLPVEFMACGINTTGLLQKFQEVNPGAELQLSGNPNKADRFVIWYSGELTGLRLPPEAAINDGMLCILREGNKPWNIAELMPKDDCPMGCLYKKSGWSFGYDKNGMACWKRRTPRIQDPVRSIRTQTTFNGYTVEQLIHVIVEGNPGTMLQIAAANGVLPCMTLMLNGKEPEDLWLPNWAKYHAGAINVSNDQGISVCILTTER